MSWFSSASEDASVDVSAVASMETSVGEAAVQHAGLSASRPKIWPFTSQLTPKNVSAMASTTNIFASKLTGKISKNKVENIPIPQTL